MAKHGLFHELASERLAGWIERAEDALQGTGVRLYLTGGNDDEPSVLETLERHDGDRVVASEGRLVELDGEHTMITVGLSTPTPWDTPREASEEEIAQAIEQAVASVPDVGRCVFNLHCPPKDTPIDTCLKLEVRPASCPGRSGTAAVPDDRRRERGGARGDRALPAARRAPRAHPRVGRSVPDRPDPDVQPRERVRAGVLQGVIVSLRGGRLVSYQHTQG